MGALLATFGTQIPTVVAGPSVSAEDGGLLADGAELRGASTRGRERREGEREPRDHAPGGHRQCELGVMMLGATGAAASVACW